MDEDGNLENEIIVIAYLSEFMRRLNEGEDFQEVMFEIAERIDNLYKEKEN